MEIEALGLPNRATSILLEYGVTSVESLVRLNEREVLGLPGLGTAAVGWINRALAELGYALAEDPFAPNICARQGLPRGDARLASFWLCGPCAEQWLIDAFDGAEPVFSSGAVTGFCSYCNRESRDVRLFQWFLCGVCERVMRSIGRGLASAAAFVAAWHDHVAPRLPDLELWEIDAPSQRRRTSELIEGKVATVDFEAVDRRSGDAVFGIELKTGTGSIGRGGVGAPMSEFQLDVSDCNDILAVVARDRMPVYLVHSQVVDLAAPPTVQYVGTMQWWTDLLSMERDFVRLRMRAGERKMAAYYRRSMFRPLSELAEHLGRAELAATRRALRERRWRPELYRLPA